MRRQTVSAVLGAACIAGFLIWSSLRAGAKADEDWQRVRAFVEQEAPARALRAERRVALLPADGEGEAFEHYGKALEYSQAAIAAAATADPLEVAVTGRSTPPPPTWQEALDELLAGAHSRRRTVQAPSLRASVLDLPVTDIGDLVDGTLTAARAAAAQGDSERAVDLLLAQLTMILDLLAPEVLVMEMAAAHGLGKLTSACSDDDLAQLPAEQLRRFAEGLLHVDQAFPPVVTSAGGEVLAFAADLAATHGHGSPGVADDVEGLRRRSEQCLEVTRTAAAPWSARAATLRRLDAELAAHSAEAAGFGLYQLAPLETGKRQSLARLRLLRLAVAHHLGEELPMLQDPLGDGALTATTAGDEIRFASQGLDDGKPIERTAKRR